MNLKRKSVIAGLISAAIIMPSATGISFANGENNTSEQAKTVDYRTITGNSVNFRKGPGTNHASIGKLNKGYKVEYLESVGSWVKIKYNGTEGFVYGDYVSNSSQGGGNTDTSVKENKQVTGSKVNFRTGPGTNYSIITSLGRGTTVGVISESNGWSKVSYNGNIGYMSSNYLGTVNSGGGDVSQGADAVISLGMQQLGKPYVWGAEGPNSFDCSGFTQYVFKNAAGINLPRVSREQARFGTAVSRSNLQKGDLIFFDTDHNGSVNHVGIYMGNNEFIHASSGAKKVVVSQLNSFYSSAYTNARRVL